MFMCSREHFGFLPTPLKSHQMLQEAAKNLVHTLIEAILARMDHPPSMFVQLSCQWPSSLPLAGVCVHICLLSYWFHGSFPFPSLFCPGV